MRYYIKTAKCPANGNSLLYLFLFSGEIKCGHTVKYIVGIKNLVTGKVIAHEYTLKVKKLDLASINNFIEISKGNYVKNNNLHFQGLLPNIPHLSNKK